MVKEHGFYNRRSYISSKIWSLFTTLTEEPSEYDKITLKIEYWIA